MQSPATVAVLFARSDSVYKTLPGCDVWDIDRDARNWPGGSPVVAHPPCRAWGKLSHFARPRVDEKALALFAVDMVRKFGGVLEHPSESTLWAAKAMPAAGRAPDQFGGWTALVRQCDWGHRAEKPTNLYIVGCHPDDLPPLPPSREPTHVIGDVGRASLGNKKPEVSKEERERTPPQLATWLVELARKCKPKVSP